MTGHLVHELADLARRQQLAAAEHHLRGRPDLAQIRAEVARDLIDLIDPEHRQRAGLTSTKEPNP